MSKLIVWVILFGVVLIGQTYQQSDKQTQDAVTEDVEAEEGSDYDQDEEEYVRRGGFMAAPDVSEIKIEQFECNYDSETFRVRFKQLGYQQVVSAWFRNLNVDLKCAHKESIYDEDEQWVIGFIQECILPFDANKEVTNGRFEVKIFDGPLKMNHIRDSVYVDCPREDPNESNETLTTTMAPPETTEFGFTDAPSPINADNSPNRDDL